MWSVEIFDDGKSYPSPFVLRSNFILRVWNHRLSSRGLSAAAASFVVSGTMKLSNISAELEACPGPANLEFWRVNFVCHGHLLAYFPCLLNLDLSSINSLAGVVECDGHKSSSNTRWYLSRVLTLCYIHEPRALQVTALFTFGGEVSRRTALVSGFPRASYQPE